MAFGGTLNLEFKISLDSKEAQAQAETLRAKITAAASEIGAKVSTSFRSATQSSEKLFTAFDQLRIGIEQLSRGSLGGVPNLIKAFRNGLGDLIAGLSTGSLAAVGFGAAVVAALGVVVAGIAGTVLAAKGMISTAEDLGTTSREKFDEFRKAVEAAEFSVTELDRALGQQLVGAVTRVKGASDGLFVELIRSSGPQLTALLNNVSDLLRDLAPVAKIAGAVIANLFNVASAAVDLFRISIKAAFTDFNNFAAFISSPEAVIKALVFGVKAAQAEAKKLKETAIANPFEDKKKARSGPSDLTDFELQLNRLRRATEDAQTALDTDLDAIRAQFKGGQLSGEEFFQAIVAREEEFVRLQQQFVNEERKLIERSNLQRNRRLEELDRLATREAKIINDSTKRTIAADRDVATAQMKALEDAEKAEAESRKRREQIAKVADAREIARLEGLANQRVVSFEQAEREIAAIRRRAIDRQLGSISGQFLTTNDITEQQRLEGEYALLLEERAKVTEESTGRIISARDKDIEALRKLQKAQREILDDLRREEQQAATQRANNLADRAQLDPRFQLEAVQAVTEARRQAAIEENRLNLQRIEADEAAAIAAARNARASAAEIEQIEADSLARRINEQRRFVEEIDGINRQGRQGENDADPSSNGSVFGVDLDGEQTRFGAFGSSVKSALGDLSASMGSFRDLARSVFSTIAQGAQASLAAFILTGKAGGLAFKKLAADVIAAVAVQSAVKAIFELAEGFAALARYDFASATNHFAAAKIYGLTAAAAGAVGAAIGAAGGLGGGAAGAGGFGGSSGSFGSSQPQQINLNRGGDGERLGVGEAGADLVAGGLFGQLVVAVQQQSQATAQLAARIDSIPEGEIIRRGAPQATDAIGQAVLSELRRSADFTNDAGRVLFGPA